MSTTKPLWWSSPTAILRYAVVIVSIAATVIILKALEHSWKSTPFISLFLCAIMFNAWYGGFKPALLASALSVLAFDYYFLPPTHSLVPHLNEVPRLVLFTITAFAVGLLTAAQRSSTDSLRLARDSLAAKVQELERAIGERDRAQNALHQAQSELAHRTRLTIMGELTASIAHEVGQPLTGVVNNANACLDLLPDGAPELKEVREALTEIIDDADRASAIILRVRQLSKRAPIEKSLLDLRGVVNDVLALARYESGTRRITIRTELPNDLPLVSGDRVQLQQVLLNLVVNGMDAMNTVEESQRMLIIRACHEIQNGVPAVLLCVKDAGAGLKPEEMGRLFEAFYTTKPEGMGMGLAICRSIIEAHGGRMWAEPNQGPGATFFFSLPDARNAAS